MLQTIMPHPTTVYNDNMACVCWSKSTTPKGLRHVQMRENAIRESIASDFASIKHIEGKINLADLFTKEDKDVNHFVTVRNHIMGSHTWEMAQPQLINRRIMIDAEPVSIVSVTEAQSPGLARGVLSWDLEAGPSASQLTIT